MLWGLTDHFVGEVIQVYTSREQAERALTAVLCDEPEWEGMIEVIPVPQPVDSSSCWPGRRVRPRCRRR